MTAPGAFYTSAPSASVAFNGVPPRPSGGAGASTATGNFTWQIVDGKLIIDEDPAGVTGFNVEGSLVGSAFRLSNPPRGVGVIGKDLKTISITGEKMQVETVFTVFSDGTTRETPRVCIRERLLRKL